MDAFSIAVSLGMNEMSSLKRLLIPSVVGVMHFIMPMLGLILGNKLFSIFNINSKFIVSIILLYLAILMFMDRNKESKQKITSIFSIFLFAFSVSIDSFSVGIGLSGLTDKYIIASTIFALCSASITYIGLLLGKYSVELLKDKAIYLGICILVILAIVNICQIF